mgnify:CR=1 FL=1
MSPDPNRLSLREASDLLAYDRRRVTPGIVHLGVGAFHRAHMAVYLDDLLRTDPSWGIIGASLRSASVHKALAPQDCLYTLLERGPSGTSARVIGSLLDVLVAPAHRGRLLAAMADPAIRIVSLTVTEKGYCHDPATGELQETHPDIVHDIGRPSEPGSVPGLIVRALEMRRAAGVPPFAVLSCDNLPENGKTVAGVITAFAGLRNDELAEYVARKVAFPSTMVDRIVPATTDEDRNEVVGLTGLEDQWPVAAEPFSQFVIEDRFPAGRPEFELAGAELVSDVRPYENMKLRMLNGSHSSLAYLGFLAGHELISGAMGEPVLRQFVHQLMTCEVMPTLPAGLGDLASYRDSVIQRFTNPALKHRTWQIAMDGSQKLPQRLLGTIRDRLSGGGSIDLASLGVAAWMRYAAGVDEQGRAIDVRDPLSDLFRAVGEAERGDPGGLVRGFLGIRQVFAPDLAENAVFCKTLTRHMDNLMGVGALATVRRVLIY